MSDASLNVGNEWDAERRIPFVCLGSGCPNTCCGPFHGTRALEAILTPQDLGKIVRGPFDPVEADLSAEVSIFAQIRLLDEDVERIQSIGKDDLIVRRGDSRPPAYYMRLLPDGTCAALSEDHSCSIHPSRPTLCRAFPFYFDLFAGLSMVESCPGVGAGMQTMRELREDIIAAIELYHFWLKLVRLELEKI